MKKARKKESRAWIAMDVLGIVIFILFMVVGLTGYRLRLY